MAFKKLQVTNKIDKGSYILLCGSNPYFYVIANKLNAQNINVGDTIYYETSTDNFGYYLKNLNLISENSILTWVIEV